MTSWNTTTGRRFLTVVLDGIEHGIGVPAIRDIVRLQRLQPLASEDLRIRGLLELRSQFVPVVDLRLWMGVPAHMTKLACILVVQIEVAGRPPVLVGVIVDTIHEVFTVAGDTPTTFPSPSDLARGVTAECQVKGRPKRLLDLERVFPAEMRETFVRIALSSARPETAGRSDQPLSAR